MPSDEKKAPMEELKDKVRSLFGSRDPQKKKDGLPPKTHFSIWYFLIAMLLDYLLAAVLSFSQTRDDSLQSV